MPILGLSGKELVQIPSTGWVSEVVVLACPGPSLAKWTTDTLNQAAARALGSAFSLVALNTAYPRIRPELWIGMDSPSNFLPALVDEPFKKIFRINFSDELCLGMRGKTDLLKSKPGAFFATFLLKSQVESEEKSKGEPVKPTHEKCANFLWRGNSFSTALDILVWMGVKKIVLVGCDFGGGRDYYDERVLSGPARLQNQSLYREIVRYLREVAPQAEEQGVEIISATPLSPVNEFLKCIHL